MISGAPSGTPQPPEDVRIRSVTQDDTVTVRRLLTAALLEPPSDLEVRLAAGEGYLAVDGRDTCVALGVLVLDEGHIEAIAVRRSRRNRGIGTALVNAAAEGERSLTAEFRPAVRPFYESLGFEISQQDGRLRGRLSVHSDRAGNP